MRQVRSRHTSPEIALRKELWALGFRYRLHCRKLPGNPDIVFPRHRVAVFIDGDFWHGNQWRLRGFRSLEEQFRGVSNASYWIPKIRRNMERDAESNRRLRRAGWTVVRLWESQLKARPAIAVQRVVRALSRRKGGR